MTDSREQECAGCDLAEVGRRRFLRDIGAAVAATLFASALQPAIALAETARDVSARRRTGSRVAYAIPEVDSVEIDSDNDVIIVRWEAKAYAFSLACPHRGTSLRWRPEEARFFCPKHKARFTPNGDHASGRKTTALDRHAIRKAGGDIEVDLAVLYKADEDRARWASAMVTLA